MCKNILITGGTGYIGSHTAVKLLEQNYNPILLDNLSNSSLYITNQIKSITNKEFLFINGDINNQELLDNLFSNYQIDAVIHFAALKSIAESIADPISYFHNNISGTINLVSKMKSRGIKKFIFSSSATVYGKPSSLPIKEDFSTSVNNPYGRTKLIIENMLDDICASDPSWKIIKLRYFNPVGAHKSGLLGELPRGIPNNLLPYISQTAAGLREYVMVYGNDYPTKDGTGVRDYIHIDDLAEGHMAALSHIDNLDGSQIFNLGTGIGYSVLEMIESFSQCSGVAVPYKIVDRRPGDVAECWADPSKANQALNWRTQKTLKEICDDAWRWQKYVKENQQLFN